MFVIAGITGHTGSATANALLGAGHEVRGIARDPAKAAVWSARGAEIVASALTDAEGLTRAFDGAEAAYMLAPPDLGHPDPVALYTAVAHATRSAARATGLRRLVFLSSFAAHRPAGTGPIRGLYEAEQMLADAAPETVFLRPAYFMENWRDVLAPALDGGVLPTLFANLDAPQAMVATADIGAAAATLLTERAPSRVVELSGPADYSVRDVAQAITAVFGRTVAPVQPPREAWVGILQEAGIGPAYAALIAEMYDGLNDGIVVAEGVADQRRGVRTIQDTIASWRPA